MENSEEITKEGVNESTTETPLSEELVELPNDSLPENKFYPFMMQSPETLFDISGCDQIMGHTGIYAKGYIWRVGPTGPTGPASECCNMMRNIGCCRERGFDCNCARGMECCGGGAKMMGCSGARELGGGGCGCGGARTVGGCGCGGVRALDRGYTGYTGYNDMGPTGPTGPVGLTGRRGPMGSLSQTFINVYSNKEQQIFAGASVIFDTHTFSCGDCYHTPNSSEIYIWRPGYYFVHTSIFHLEASQFSLQKNGLNIIEASTIGSLVGAAQTSTSFIMEIDSSDICVTTDCAPYGNACVIQLINNTAILPSITLYGADSAGNILPQTTASMSIILLK